MWNALPITQSIYGFQQEHSYSGPWTATVAVNESADGLELSADIFVIDLLDGESYERLVEAIRRFSLNMKRDKGKHECLLTFRCKGIAAEGKRLPLSGKSMRNGYVLIDTEFSEEL